MLVADLQSLPVRFSLFVARREPDGALLQHGLGSPVVVSTEPRCVVWGEHLIAAAHRVGVGELSHHDVHAPPAELLRLALRLEGRVDGYTWEEQARICDAAAEVGIDPTETELNALVTTKGSFAHRVKRYQALPDQLAEAVSAALIDLSVAERAARIPQTVLTELLAASTGMSHSNRRQLLDLVREIMLRDELPPGTLADVVLPLLSGADPVSRLRTLRYPSLTRLESQFAALRDASLGGTGVALSPPPFFEGDAYTVSFSFSDAESLRRRIRALEQLEKRCDDLFHLL